MRVVWVHPSWRDLVIEHLIANDTARAHFLRRCAVHGCVLALSTAGGPTGERELPLLITDEDWDALADRLYELAPELEELHVSAVLDALGAARSRLHGTDTDPELRALSQTVLTRISCVWDAAQAPVPLDLLESWLGLARDLSPAPEPAGVIRTWADLLPAGAPAFDDPYAMQRFIDWLTLAHMLQRKAPRLLPRLGFPDRCRWLFDAFIDAVSPFLDDEALHGPPDPVIRAVDLISAVEPRMRRRELVFWLTYKRRDPASEIPEGPIDPDLPAAGAEPEFDVARVLADL